MKKAFSIFLLFIICIFSACSNKPVLNNSDNSTSVSTISQKDKDKYLKLYVKPLAKASIYNQPWENASEIPANKLFTFAIYEIDMQQYWDEPKQQYFIPYDVVESKVSDYFDIPKDYLKQAHSYNENTNTFISSLGLGGASNPEIISFTEQDNEIQIVFNEKYADNTIASTVVISIIKNGDKFKYNSCKVTRFNQSNKYTISQEDKEKYLELYVKPLSNSAITWKSWSKASEIPVDNFVHYISNKLEEKQYWDNTKRLYIIPYDVYYNIVNEHFDIPKNYLKKHKTYNKKTNTFDSILGYGELSCVALISYEHKDNNIQIVFENRDDYDITLSTVELNIIKNGDEFKYSSCMVTAERH